MLPRPEEQQQQQQRQFLALLTASSRPSGSAAPAGRPLELPPAAPPASWLSPWDVALCATGTAAACENALVLAALAGASSSASSGRRAPASLLLGSLALADLLSGLGLLGSFAARHLVAPGPGGEAAALGAAGLLLTAGSASLGSLLAITVDRYLSLRRALTYPARRARPAAAALLALLWLACLGLGLPPLLGWNCLRRPPAACSVLWPVARGQAALLAAAALLAFALTLLLYLRICRIASRHARQIALQRRLAASPRRGLAGLALVLGPFALCCLPLALYALLADAARPPPPACARALALLAAAAGPLLNPLIYAFRHPDIQKALWLACCGCVPASCSRARSGSSDV